jgi:periplasmic nitrate reductase NapD
MNPQRRQFIRGQWVEGITQIAAHHNATEIASVLIQARPERLDAVQMAIASMSGAEVVQRDERGKLVVVLDSAGGQSVADSLVQISLLPHVLSATLVFHGLDTA